MTLNKLTRAHTGASEQMTQTDDGEDGAPGTGRLQALRADDADRPPRRVIVAIGVLVAVAVGGWIAGSRVRSPQQAAADAQPPPPSILTAPVEARVLEKRLILRGNVVQRSLMTVNPTVEEGDAVVTGVFVQPGDVIEEGKRPIEVSARPVFVVSGAVPVFRSIRPGMTGTDVQQLQAGLQRMGYAVEPDGIYGASTKSAIARLYGDHGYDPALTSPTAQADLRTAERAVDQAEQQVASAQAAHDAAAEPEQTGLALSLDAAASELDAQREILAELEETTGVMVPRSELVFVPDLPGRVVSVKPLGANAGGSEEGVAGTADTTSGAGVMTIASGPVEIVALAPVNDESLVAVGQVAALSDESDGDWSDAKVASVATGLTVGTDGTSGREVVLMPTDPGRLPGLGEPVNLTIVVASSGDRALVVPLSAIYTATDGEDYVTVADNAGDRHRVAVSLGLSADGYVVVEPSSGAELVDGENVLIGEA